MNIDDKAEFVILGFGQGYEHSWPAFTLGNFRYIDLTGGDGLSMKYEAASVLDFGRDFTVTPDYSGKIEIDEGPLFSRPGSLIRVKDEDCLIFGLKTFIGGPSDLRYLALPALRPSSQRNKPRVAFASWSITLQGEDQPLIRHTAPST
jgi:hypothetical protein